MLTNKKYSGRRPLVVVAALLSLMILLPLAGCKTEVDPVDPPTRYTVKFETAHGTAPSDITVDSGTKLTAEQLESLDGTASHIFEGWYDGETKAVGDKYTVTKDVTLVAKWKSRDKVEIKLTVSGNTVELASVPAGATIHYTTDGTDPKTSETSQTGTSVSITQETTIKAYAEKVGDLKDSDVAEKTYYVVTFNANGGTETMDPQIFTDGVAQKLTANGFSRSGYGFAGWAESADGVVKYTDGQEITVTADTTLYAKWGVASVRTADGTITSYDTFDVALAAAMDSTGSTLTLLADINRSSSISVTAGDFTLDLNGKAIISSAATIVKTSGSASLTVTDTSEGQTGAIKPESDAEKSALCTGITHSSSGGLRIRAGSITAAASSDNGSCGVDNRSSSGTVEITGGTIAGGETASDSSIGVRNYAWGSVTISGGNVSGGSATDTNSCGVWNVSGGTVEITGGTIKSGFTKTMPSMAVNNAGDGLIIISGTPSITAGASTASGSYGVWNYGSGDVLISGSPTIAGGTAGSGKISASFRVQTADTSAITLESGFAPASGTFYTISMGGTTGGIFAKPGTGATLDASWFTSYDASKFTVEKVGDNLELKAVTQ